MTSGTSASAPTSKIPTSKVTAASLGGAIATIFWIIAAATFWKGTFDETALTALTGSTATVMAFVFGYVVNETRATD